MRYTGPGGENVDGVELKARREALGLRAYQIAGALGVPPSTVHRWETEKMPLRGLTAIGVDTVLRGLERKRRPAPADREG
jgi:transcriptional regulator with XRE-family HTH domain